MRPSPDDYITRHAQVAAAWKTIIVNLGYDPNGPHFKDSPARVAKFLLGWHTQTQQPPDMTTFPVDNYDSIVVVQDIPFFSMCAHHGLPFYGKAAIGYLPGDGKSGKLVGLSKLVRVLEHFAHRFQTQEQITEQTARYLEEKLGARGVGVVLRAEHMCMSLRGVHSPGHSTSTSTMLGAFRNDEAARAELLELIRGTK